MLGHIFGVLIMGSRRAHQSIQHQAARGTNSRNQDFDANSSVCIFGRLVIVYGNSLVYSINYVAFPAYVLKYQHWEFSLLENQHRYADISA